MSGAASNVMFVFPGQGSQYRSMGSDLHDKYPLVRELYSEASDILGFDMAELSFRDPKDQLGLTAFTQPALLTHSIACYRVFEELSGGCIEPAIVGGHSLGEYSALVVAGALSFGDALRLVRRRGELMGERGQGIMVAAAMELEALKPYIERHYCGVGGCNLPNQTVVGGLEDDIEALTNAVKADHPRARMTTLKTEGAFHTHLMTAAALAFRPELKAVPMKAPTCRVLSNYSGDFHDPDPAAIKYRLFFQLFHPVKWLQNVQRALEEGVSCIFEFGGGVGKEEVPASRRPNLAAMLKRIIKAGVGRHGRRDQDYRPIDGRALYYSGIHAEDIASTATSAIALSRINVEVPGAVGRLHVPSRGGIPVETAVAVTGRFKDSLLDASLEVVTEDEAVSAIACHEHFGSDKPDCYLEVLAGSDGAKFRPVDEVESFLAG